MSYNKITPLIDSNNIDFCYKIHLSTGQLLYLTSAAHPTICNNNTYMPNSSLELQIVIVDDSGNVMAEINGLFEDGGIINDYVITDAKIEIFTVVNDQNCNKFLSLYCNAVEHNNIKFRLKLVSEIVKLNKSALKVYSHNCRAEFGDLYCKIDTKKHTKDYSIKSINLNHIIITGCDPSNTNYTHGNLEIAGNKACEGYQFKVIGHYNVTMLPAYLSKNYVSLLENNDSLIEISMIIPEFLRNTKTISLTLGCNKTFLSCCTIFNNAINFRAEPFILELKNFT